MNREEAQEAVQLLYDTGKKNVAGVITGGVWIPAGVLCRALNAIKEHGILAVEEPKASPFLPAWQPCDCAPDEDHAIRYESGACLGDG
jgi:hypothetical protein